MSLSLLTVHIQRGIYSLKIFFPVALLMVLCDVGTRDRETRASLTMWSSIPFYTALLPFSFSLQFMTLSPSSILIFQRLGVTSSPSIFTQEWSSFLSASISTLGFILQASISADTRQSPPSSLQLRKNTSESWTTSRTFNMSIIASSSIRVLAGSVDWYACVLSLYV